MKIFLKKVTVITNCMHGIIEAFRTLFQRSVRSLCLDLFISYLSYIGNILTFFLNT